MYGIKVLLRSYCTENWAIPNLLRVDYQSLVDGFADWALLLPQNSETWIVNIHGHGSHGDQLYSRCDIREAWLSRFLERKVGILSVNLRNNAWMCPAAAADLHGLLQWMRIEYGLQRTLFWSGSMGGTSNLIYAALHSADVDGIVSLGAATDIESYYDWCVAHQNKPVLNEIAQAIERAYEKNTPSWKERLQRHSALRNMQDLEMPIYLAHGNADQIIPVEQSRQFAEMMQEKKYFYYNEIQGGDHDAPLWDESAWNFVQNLL